MNAPLGIGGLKKQHIIDPEICIRCNTCEATCPVGAITHDAANYVVAVEKCNFCMSCVPPCPTGAVDNWRIVRIPYTLDEQYAWTEMPPQADVAGVGPAEEAIEAEVSRLLEEAHTGTGGKPQPPPSAAKPTVNLFTRSAPVIATVQGNLRITAASAESDIRHVVLGFGENAFPVLEGQSIGIIPPGTRADGKPHEQRLYSIASSREGEKRNGNNIALTVKRVPGGVASNYVCDLKVGDKVQVTGPFGATFLMPGDPAADIIMICTGTGSAPFRAFTERRRRVAPAGPGKLVMFFGSRSPEELPYFGPLQKVPSALLEKHLVFSRIPGTAKEYVQDRMRIEAERVAELLGRDTTHVFICGLRGMEAGVDEAFADIMRGKGRDWQQLKSVMRGSGRYHVETY